MPRDPVLHDATEAARRLLGGSADSVERARGSGRNSGVYRIRKDGTNYALKQYPPRRPEERDRAAIELAALHFMTAHGIAAVPLYVLTDTVWLMWLGAFLVGFFAAGSWGIVPTYLNERFPTAVRAVGAGFAYHVGAAVGSFTPTIIGALQDRGMALGSAMAFSIALAGVLVIATVWMGPETRGRQFQATD